MKPSIYGLTQEQLQNWLVENGEKRFRADQVWDWLYRKRVKSFDEMKNVNQATIDLLSEHYQIQSLNETIKQESVDGTVKFLFELPDGNHIETVLMRFDYGLSVCVTTQVGCNIGCSFCASGILRKNRDLSSGEIVEQIMNVQHDLDARGDGERVSHIVVMGIGEPFDNYDNTLDFIKVVNDQKGLSIGARHITISTSGIVPKMYDFADEGLQVNLALSLHAPNNELRTSVMKINRAYPVEQLMDAVDYYLEQTNRRITFEYILLHDVNDQREQALELVELLKDKRHLSYVNLIPYNPVADHPYERSSKQNILTFYETLLENNINCGVRVEQGSDIDAACGQLRSKQMNKKQKEKTNA
ncbi:23S rRNA (adenine(2503)-C(2))-methyltransferase RlmN [Alkalibacillus almallahensis]|uniref:23S rRNA (adenine(2503)-C(2))-methyltransferase RlmN n=1 Tax=Alkalibacillus almallahensis TaxID=1379154 RepID=UPI0014203302|nr:23S rRNA (adenine(2503)-C(2))-methyltransferase RlmN [Alkalibacillus almallahensis]NIK11457.1 23S rRNA (adenine2503-C2)-methyltransferase [Alkalibacillus almallahensis]